VTTLVALVDLQQDYLDAPGLEPCALDVVRGAHRLLDAARGAGVPVVHVHTSVRRDDDRRMPHWRAAGRWRCEVGTPGHAPPPSLSPRAGEHVIDKQGWSAFDDRGAFAALLLELGVRRLVVGGVHLHACVREVVTGAHERGIDVTVAEDAVASDDPLQAATVRAWLTQRGVRFVATERLRRSVTAALPPDRSGADADDAVGRARDALPLWAGLDAHDRAAVLRAFADRLSDAAPALGAAMATGIGKPVRYGVVEAARAADAARAAVGRLGDSGPEPNGTAQVVHRRHGVVAAVTPWNNPLYIPVTKLVPALGHGNTVVWKPSPRTHDLALELVAMLHRAGLPEGAVTVVAGDRAAAEAVLHHPGLDAITVTGSSLTGWAAQAAAARRRLPLQAELGGNNAALVWDDADLADAARHVADGAFAQAGQRCTANRRVVVPRRHVDRFRDLLAAAVDVMAWGDPRREETVVGPMVATEQAERVAAFVDAAGARGLDVRALAGARPQVDGFDGRWCAPTVVRCDDPDDELVQEETFGPVLVVQPADDWGHAVDLVGGVRQGLVASIFTADPDRARAFADAVPVGMVKVNRSTADAEVDVPFVGWRWSGLGPPEHGRFDADAFTRPQVRYRP
jgi:acyl-CoA reductase-like NAD-dependent aldehyde dehydrogenase